MKRALAVLGTLTLGVMLSLTGGLAANAESPPENTTAEVYWALPDTALPIPPTDNNPSIWPQDYSPDGASQCGVWYQVDTYDVEDIPALIEDNVLDEGEDYGVVISWRFEYGGDCTVVEVPAALDYVDACGVNNIVVTPPENTEGVTWSVDTSTPGFVYVTATANAGYILYSPPTEAGDEETATEITWEYQDSGELCPVVVTPPPAPPELALTGAPVPALWWLLGVAMVGTGVLLTVERNNKTPRF